MEEMKRDKRYTYADYETWDTDERYELIRGIPYLLYSPDPAMMAPAPTPEHQSISGELFRQLANFLHGKPCKVYSAPLDVRLSDGSHDDTVVQPDLIVVCDKSKLDGKHCDGAPDMIVEILSPSTAGRDHIVKYKLYLASGVREYWIIDPNTKTVMIHILEGGKYQTSTHEAADTVPVRVLDGCSINLADVFAE